MRRGLTFRTLLAAVVLGVLAIGGFGLMTAAVQSLRAAGQAETRSMQVLVTANGLERRLLDLETGLRGYLISVSPRFLQPYRAALAAYPGLARDLLRLTASEPRQHARAVVIRSGIGGYVRDWAQPRIRQARSGHAAAARSAIAAGRGKALVDALRARFGTLTSEEARISAVRTRQADVRGSLAFAIGVAGMIVSAIAVTAAAAGTHRIVVVPVRRLAAGVARVSAGDLSARVPQGGTAEVGQLTAGFNAMTGSLENQRTELESQQSELESQQSELESQQVELEEALNLAETEKEHAELRQRFGQRLASAAGVESASQVALQETADAAHAETGALYLYDDRPGTFLLAARRGLDPAALPPGISPGDGTAGRALAERRIVRASYAQASLQAASLGLTRTALHELSLPLGRGDRIIGVVCLGRCRDEPFADADIPVLADLAGQAAVACAEAQSVRQVERVAHELETLLASTDEGIYAIDSGGRITLANQAALRQTGYHLDDLLGRDSHELLHHTHADGTPYPGQDCPAARVLSTGTGARVADEVFWHRDGTAFPVEYSAYPLFDGDQVTGAVVTFADITARKQTERQDEARHTVTQVLAGTRAGDDAWPGVIAAVCDRLGLAIGLAWETGADAGRLRCVASHAAPGFEAAAARLADGELAAGEGPAGVVLARHDPAIFRDLEREPPRPGMPAAPPLRSALAVPVADTAGKLLAVLEFFADRDLAEPGLSGTVAAIAAQVAGYSERMRVEAETQRLRDDFVATVSHELRTPLTSIDGWLHIVLGEEPGPLSSEQRQVLTTVKRNSDRLMRLVSDLLLAGQIEAGRLSLDLGDVDLAELVRETGSLVAGQAAAKRISVSVEADGPALVRGDRERLIQLLDNLITNAVKYTPEDGQVRIGVASQDGTCQVRVSDTGIGIPAEDRPHLFQRFYRASSATAHGIGGTGLGLSISKAIAEAHHGAISLADEAGQGSVFVVEIPLAAHEEARP